MALISCHECKAQVSTEAKVCPACSAKVRLPKKKVGLVGVFFVVVVGIGIVNAIFHQQEVAQAEASKSPEQKAAEEKQRKVTAQRDALVVTAMKSIKSHLRNPGSVDWGQVLANDDGSVICIDYRAENGFGGTNHEFIAFIDGKAKSDQPSWKKNCAGKTLNDVRDFGVRWLDR